MHIFGSFEIFRSLSMHVLGSQTEDILFQTGQRSFCLSNLIYILLIGNIGYLRYIFAIPNLCDHTNNGPY